MVSDPWNDFDGTRWIGSGALFLLNVDTTGDFRNYVFINIGYTSKPSKIYVEMFGANGGVEFDQIEESSLAYLSTRDFSVDVWARAESYQVAVNGEMLDTVPLKPGLAAMGLFEVGVQQQKSGLRGLIDSTGVSQLCEPGKSPPPRKHRSCKHNRRDYADRRCQTRNWCVRMAKERIKHCQRPSVGLKLLCRMKERPESGR